MGKSVGLIVSAITFAMAGMTLGGCAGAESTIGVDPADHGASKRGSPSCSVGVVLDGDSMSGRSTPAEAIREILDDYEKQARALPVDAPRNRSSDLTQDPAYTAVVIRGLRAALESLPEAEQRSPRGGNIHVSAVDGSGTEIADIVIAHQRSGRYRVEQVRANAFPSDHFCE